MSSLGAVIAGGRSTRYGAPKALERVGGVRVVDRVTAALRTAGVNDVIAIVNDDALAQAIGLPHRADVLPDTGALGGVHAALLWAREQGHPGILAAACDMPFLSVPLLRALLENDGAADVVVPESDGPRGIEPLCAWYGVNCIEHIETAVARGDARMISFHADVRVRRIPLAAVRAFGAPSLLFRNMNTPADRDAAERLARE